MLTSTFQSILSPASIANKKHPPTHVPTITLSTLAITNTDRALLFYSYLLFINPFSIVPNMNVNNRQNWQKKHFKGIHAMFFFI